MVAVEQISADREYNERKNMAAPRNEHVPLRESTTRTISPEAKAFAKTLARILAKRSHVANHDPLQDHSNETLESRPQGEA